MIIHNNLVSSSVLQKTFKYTNKYDEQQKNDEITDVKINQSALIKQMRKEFGPGAS